MKSRIPGLRFRALIILLSVLGGTAQCRGEDGSASPQVDPISEAAPSDNAYTEETRAALEHHDKATLYSLEPDPNYQTIEELFEFWKPKLNDFEKFHGRRVLGKMELADEADKKASSAFLDAVRSTQEPSLCMFMPRRGLRVTAGGHRFDFLICYQCNQIEVLRDDVQIAFLSASGSPAALNAILESANIPLSHSGE